MTGHTSALMHPFARPISRVAIRRADSYQRDLAQIIYETLLEFALPVQDKCVFLKPNLVALDEQATINTHPAVIAAARESFLRLGARTVLVGDGPALDRDSEAIVECMRLREFLGPLQHIFVDLNVDAVHATHLHTRASSLRQLYLPATVLGADFVVSMPRLKTHHWAGVTLSMKNMFGIVPGSCYGWPKNILHWAGITRALLDINSTIRPDFAIVDGIIGMEGNGPLQGAAKACGVLIFGDDPVAVDATSCRIMALAPERIEHLERAGHLLGHLREDKISQIGESVEAVCTPFAVIPAFEKLRLSSTAPPSGS